MLFAVPNAVRRRTRAASLGHARGDGDNGDFLVVRVTEKELTVIQRKLGEWGVWRKKALTPQSEFAKQK